MVTEKSVSLQKVFSKIERLEKRLKKVEKMQSIPEIELNPKELAEIRKIKKEMDAGKFYTFKEVFGE